VHLLARPNTVIGAVRLVASDQNTDQPVNVVKASNAASPAHELPLSSSPGP
jgi:hypothetical protein